MEVGGRYLVRLRAAMSPEALAAAIVGDAHLKIVNTDGTYRLVGVRPDGWLEIVRLT